MTASEHTELLPAIRQWHWDARAPGMVEHPHGAYVLVSDVQALLAARALPDGAEPVPVAWPDGDFVEYGRVHNIAISAYEAATPPDYRYSAVALRKAVDAAIRAALHPTSETTPARLCATDGCERAGTTYFERGGVGSHYCPECIARIEALSEARHG